MRKIALATVIAAAIGLSTAVMAGDNTHGRMNVPAADWKSAAEIKDKLVAAGYTVREIEKDDGAYEVDVIDKDGTRMEFHVHPATGDVLHDYAD